MDHSKKMNIDIKSLIESNIEVTKSLLKNLDLIEKICVKSLQTIKNGGKVIICGNGGSASDSIHIASEIVGKFEKDRKALPSLSLSANPSNLTAIGNDFGFEDIFSRQIEALCTKDDVLIAISTSGESKNILEAAKFSNHNNLQVISLTGNDGGELKNLSDININIPMKSTQRIQEMHILIGHIICDLIERNYTS